MALLPVKVPWTQKPPSGARPSGEFAKDLWQFIVPAADGWANIAPQTKGDWNLGVGNGTFTPSISSSLGRSWVFPENTSNVACMLHTGAGGKVRPPTPITIMARVNMLQTNKYGQISITDSDTGWNPGGYFKHYNFIINPTNHYASKLLFRWHDSSFGVHTYITPSGVAVSGEDTVVAVTYDFSTLRFFANGVEVHTVAIASDFQAEPIDHSSGWIRAFWSDSSNGPACEGDFLTIHNRALTPEEIAHYSEDFNGRAFQSRIRHIPVGSGGGVPVSASHSSALESVTGLAAGGAGVVESVSAVSAAVLSAMESLLGVGVARGAVTESTSAVGGAVTSITESTSAVGGIANTVLESRQGLIAVSRDISSAVESLQSIAVARATPAESVAGLAAVSRSVSTEVESLCGVMRAQAAPFAVLAGMSRAVSGELETVARVVVSGALAAEVLTQTSQGLQVSAEALAMVSAAAGVSIEALGAGIAPTYEDLEMLLRGEQDLVMVLTDVQDYH